MDGSYLENEINGERTPIERNSGVFTLKFWVALAPMSESPEVLQLAPFNEGGGSGSSDLPPSAAGVR